MESYLACLDLGMGRGVFQFVHGQVRMLPQGEFADAQTSSSIEYSCLIDSQNYTCTLAPVCISPSRQLLVSRILAPLLDTALSREAFESCC